jgi:hypothetical protein
MAIENKEDLVKKVAVLEDKLLPLRQASEELVLVKKQLVDVLKSK